jgi:hypothetical protein
MAIAAAYASFVKRWGIVAALASVVVVSTFVSYKNFTGSCRYIISHYLKNNKALYEGRTSLIYLINNVSLCCRQCYDYERYRESPFAIYFFVEGDYSEYDIQNSVPLFRLTKTI